ncbi:16S rRNA (cytosine(967)-C(5))-methyltransferase RsmB [Thalassotalea sp. PLHSN55]|uniref:16S rRNA (cytosine(967)-C(5))-methyltransferase RsmB n=1 Tax=Thalassotalea sp. PLHSN55 TaxID=3435888 RepID=UPI003F859DE9
MAINLRALAATCTFNVVDKGKSLADELPKHQEKLVGKDKGLLQELCYGVLRYLPELEFEARQFISKPLVGKQRVGHFLVLVGLYQIRYTRIPDHAAVSETVAATSPLRCKHLKGVVNAVLRSFQRKADEKATNDQPQLPAAVKYNHPSWFIKKLQTAYPEQWQNILVANQQKPPMWLRVNQQHHSVSAYLKLLDNADISHQRVDQASGAILLSQAVDVNTLPGFEQGWVSIQDGAAQQAARLLGSQTGENILDCCAAPGGKTCHVLELTPAITMTAIDIEEKRLLRVEENLQRLHLSAKVIAGDAAHPENWWDGKHFDRILLDAPCSATGVIRRHPDIKWLRKANDIEALAELQQQILRKTWSLLKPGGTLIYATCSILPQENSEQVSQFLADYDDAQLVPIDDKTDSIGWQILPDESAMDGFYYAKLIKREAT